MIKNNYKEYDVLNLLVKQKKVKDIIERYKIFGWEVFEESENRKYQDIIDLTLVRKHKINNKDELQLYQVHMEENLNKQGKLEKNKYSKSLCFGLFFGGLGLILFLFNILNLIKFFTWALTPQIICLVVGIIFILLVVIFVPIIVKREKRKFISKKEALEEKLKTICDYAKKLATEKYEED